MAQKALFNIEIKIHIGFYKQKNSSRSQLFGCFLRISPHVLTTSSGSSGQTGSSVMIFLVALEERWRSEFESLAKLTLGPEKGKRWVYIIMVPCTHGHHLFHRLPMLMKSANIAVRKKKDKQRDNRYKDGPYARRSPRMVLF